MRKVCLYLKNSQDVGQRKKQLPTQEISPKWNKMLPPLKRCHRLTGNRSKGIVSSVSLFEH